MGMTDLVLVVVDEAHHACSPDEVLDVATDLLRQRGVLSRLLHECIVPREQLQEVQVSYRFLPVLFMSDSPRPARTGTTSRLGRIPALLTISQSQ